MLKDIVERKSEEKFYFRLEFDLIEDPTAGLSFDCDAQGNVKITNEAAQENYDYAVAHPEKYHQPQVRKIKYLDVEPAHGKCECGETVYLQNQYMGACQCPKCEQWYNLFGQELNPPEMWNEDFGY